TLLLSRFPCSVHQRSNLQTIDPALQVRRKVALVPDLEIGQFPIVACDLAPAIWRSAGTGHREAGITITHRVVEADLLARCNVPKGDQGYLPAQPRRRIARVIYAIGIIIVQTTAQILIFVNLNSTVAGKFWELIKYLGGHNRSSPDHQQFIFGYR